MKVLIILMSLLLSTNVILLIVTFDSNYKVFTENNGGPRDDNFGMINTIRDLNNSKINDNDNNNNNNVNVPMYQNGTNNTMSWVVYIINYNYNFN